jgi:hypothetical protein
MMHPVKEATASMAVPPEPPVPNGRDIPLPVRWDHPSEQDRRRSEAEQAQTDIAAGR